MPRLYTLVAVEGAAVSEKYGNRVNSPLWREQRKEATIICDFPPIYIRYLICYIRYLIYQTRSHTFVEIDHEIISTVILLPSAD